MDLLIGVAESSEDAKLRTRFTAWLADLHAPPAVDLVRDVDRVEDAVWHALLEHWEQISQLHAAGQSAVDETDDAPEGWDNSTLLAEMRRAYAAG